MDYVTSPIQYAWQTIASIGWYLVAVGVALFYASPYIKEKYQTWKRSKDEKEYDAKYKKDPDLASQRLMEIERARQKQQERYNEQQEEAKRKEEERKELKRQELLKLTEGKDLGNRLGTGESDGASSSKSSSYKTEYNPLMGDSSRGYRAPKKSGCCKKGGGCG